MAPPKDNDYECVSPISPSSANANIDYYSMSPVSPMSDDSDFPDPSASVATGSTAPTQANQGQHNPGSPSLTNHPASFAGASSLPSPPAASSPPVASSPPAASNIEGSGAGSANATTDVTGRLHQLAEQGDSVPNLIDLLDLVREVREALSDWIQNIDLALERFEP